MFYFPTDRLHHDLTAVLASFAAVEFRVAANMGTDGAGWDAQRQGNFGAVLSLSEHFVNDFDVLFFSWIIPPLNLRFHTYGCRPLFALWP